MEVPEKKITRRDLPAVVKRAAELAAQGDDADDALSEQEVLRIAAELGIPARHVKQALFEGVREEDPPTLLDRQLGTPRIMATRAVPLDAERARKVIENYLVTCEYLSVVRRQGNSITLEPAADTVSKVARAFKRSSKHQLASAQIVEATVQPLEAGWSHVRIRAVFEDDRRSRVANTIVGGLILGVPVGMAAMAAGGGLVALALGDLLGGNLAERIAAGVGALTGLAAMWGVVTAMLLSTRKRYRQWRERTTMQTEGVLDELEKGSDLKPPPPPWIRKLQMKFTNTERF